MKNILKMLVGIFILTGCQNELYIDPAEKFGSDQGAYIVGKGPCKSLWKKVRTI